jgi:quercetin dioxygenase-like cupin family protein
MPMRAAIAYIALAACIAGGSLVLAREPDGPSAVSAQQLFAEALAGEEGKEVIAQTYVFAAGAVLPWHIHPGTHEIAYVLEGDFTFEQAGAPPREMTAGDADYLPPNVVHRGLNKSDRPVKLFVVRIKPKDQPLVEEVPPPQ